MDHLTTGAQTQTSTRSPLSACPIQRALVLFPIGLAVYLYGFSVGFSAIWS